MTATETHTNIPEFHELNVQLGDPRWAFVRGAAASLAIAVGIGFGIGAADEMTDPPLAEAQAEAAVTEEAFDDASEHFSDIAGENTACRLILDEYGYAGQFGDTTLTAAVDDITSVYGQPCGTDRHAVRDLVYDHRDSYVALSEATRENDSAQADLAATEAQANSNDVTEALETVWAIRYFLLAGAALIGFRTYLNKWSDNNDLVKGAVRQRCQGSGFRRANLSRKNLDDAVEAIREKAPANQARRF